MAKQTTITIETRFLLVLRSRSTTQAWCPVCAAEAEMIPLQDTRIGSNLDRVAFEQWLNSGELHRVEARDGSSLICLNSLLARVQNTNPSNCGTQRLLEAKKEKT